MGYTWARYDPADDCSRMPLGAKSLAAYLEDYFPYQRSLGICNCRQVRGGKTFSHHAQCRGYDCGIPTRGGAYRPELGDPIHQLLGPHGKRLGLDHLILNRIIYSARSPDGRAYTGVHPHRDHAHIGLTRQGAANLNYATLVAVLGEPAGGPTPPPDPGDEMDPKYIADEQTSLNAAGFTDHEGKVLVVDGKYGKRTASAKAKRDKAAAATGADK